MKLIGETSFGKPYEVYTSDKYTEKLCQKNDKTIFIFGENQAQQNMGYKGGGQAIIRTCFNAYGFCTLSEIGKFWNDKNYSDNIIQIETDIKMIKRTLLEGFDSVCFPQYGLGTGRASMQSKCPMTFIYMSKRLLTEFNYNNLEHLSPPNF